MNETNTVKLPKFPIGLKKPAITIYSDPEKNKNRFGRMVYGHKTAGVIDVMTRDQFENRKCYEPGRFGFSSIKTVSKNSTAQGGNMGFHD